MTERLTALLAGGGLILLAACGGDAPAETPPLPVTLASASVTEQADEIRYAGSIKPDASVDVAFRVSGIVDAISQMKDIDGRMRALQEGDAVRRGTVLASLRGDEFRDQVSDAEATLRQAQADFERAAQLYENRSVSKADYDAAYARYTAGRARHSQALLSQHDATLRAPIDGVVLKRTVEVGALAGPSGPAFTIADIGTVKVMFGVPDVTMSRLTLGGPVAIEAEALPGVALTGRITRIAPSADPSSRVFEVEAALPNRDGRLKVGMLATLRVRGGQQAGALHIPLAAVVRPAGDSTGYAVFTVRDSSGRATARLTRVGLGDVSGNLIAVREGLEPGARVIVRGATIVADGQSVQIIP